MIQIITRYLQKSQRFIKEFKDYELRNYINYIRTKKRVNLKPNADLLPKGTSITDSERYVSYLTLCDLASENEKIFSKFRSYKVMIEVLDHVTYKQGKEYLNTLNNFGGWKPQYGELIRKLDLYGGGKKFYFKNLGTFSPTMLRYLKVHLETLSIFGSFAGLTLTEIGVGFGGQASILGGLNPPLQYNLCDLPEVLKLTNKFLSTNSIVLNCKYIDGRDPIELNSDIVISNYAFSELNRTVQSKYLDRVILKSRMGYITWNPLSERDLDGYSLEELFNLIPNAVMQDENPSTFPGNKLIVWKN